ncbi:unnamed protein product [Bursaphelenchus okinawaensis]|uniref:Uncharacterized protein n=1 Tax=Bursaphelenchus okinawaensis TaxID=465554 RepID=A0A811KNZ5_9BILA|nr:unnamed protein product [Bursaphelenchus okinawaensis]CAG9109448.1 unnamed protein product [Bursaphelenchus okinawaensis]
MSDAPSTSKEAHRDLVDLSFLVLARKIQAEGLIDASHVYPPKPVFPQFVRPTAANIPKNSSRRNTERNLEHPSTSGTPKRKVGRPRKLSEETDNFVSSLRIVPLEENRDSEERSPPSFSIKGRPGRTKLKAKRSSNEGLSPTKRLESIEESLNSEEKKVIERVKSLKAANRWSSSKIENPPYEAERLKTHWDFLLEEVKWMYLDFKNERHVRHLTTKKISTAVLKYHKDLRKNVYDEDDERAVKEREKEAKKVCSSIAKMVREFWQKAETVVDFGQKEMDEAKKREALDKHLNLLVDEADLLSKSINVESDYETEADENDAAAGMNKLAELKQLKSDANIHLDDILSHLPEGYLETYLNRKEEANIKDCNEKLVSSGKIDDLGDLATKIHVKKVNGDLQVKENGDVDKLKITDFEQERRKENGDMDQDRLKTGEKSKENGINEKGDSQDNVSKEGSDEKMDIEQSGIVKEAEKSESNSQTPEIPMEIDEMAKKDRSDALDQIAAEAEQFQPKGNTLATADVTIQHPVLIDGHLREYQLVGLQWLFSLYEKNLNGILADEMGLGKTLQTISLLAHLAAEHSVWGPHLIVVPTSVILNWEMEFKRWCPSMKVLTYFGNAKERAEKRKGWMANKSFDVCITSYKLYTQDVRCFKRKQWQYLVLDEAQHIKNFESQRWQSLINLRTRRRLLLTGTPLQNNLLELWSLLHFLMPRVFTSRDDFKDWFNNPIAGMIEGSVDYNQKIVQRLHKVLRPFILRRLKAEVEKQLPDKVEKVIKCPLSKRQRYLYNEFMSLRTTKDSLASGSMVSVLNIVMQLRKCCNHPNLFEPREVETPLCPEIDRIRYPRMCIMKNEEKIEDTQRESDLELGEMDDNKGGNDEKTAGNVPNAGLTTSKSSFTTLNLPNIVSKLADPTPKYMKITEDKSNKKVEFCSSLRPIKRPAKLNISRLKGRVNNQNFEFETYQFARKRHIEQCEDKYRPFFNQRLMDFVKIDQVEEEEGIKKEILTALRVNQEEYARTVVTKFPMYVMEVLCRPLHPDDRFYGKLYDYYQRYQHIAQYEALSHQHSKRSRLDDDALMNRLMRFPEARLIEYDCGKLQTLSRMLRTLYEEGHRCLIFTQMSKMLDILQAFLAHHGYVYFRLDGSTPVEKRQALMERFNSDNKVFCFILSTRAGGVGINLTGADTVIFYDSDWNPTMDAQAQDRCHRIGQTKNVTIYRLISSNTIEENILKKAREKRRLGEITIDEGGFTPQFFKKADNIRDLFFDDETQPEAIEVPIAPVTAVASEEELKMAMERAEDRQDVIAAKRAEAEVVAEEIEFDDKSNFNYTDQSNDEFMQIVRMLRPIEQYAVQFLSKEYRPEDYNAPLLNGEQQKAEHSNPMILESLPRKRKVYIPKKPVGPSSIQTRNRRSRTGR